MIARCRSCGLEFEPPRIADNLIIQMTNVRFKCPRCGGEADVPDDVYSFVGPTVEAFRSMTWDQANRLRALLAHQEKPTPPTDELVDAITAISPELGAIGRKLKDRKLLLAGFMIFLYLVLKQCSVSVNIDIDANQLWDQALAAALQVAPETPPK